MIKLIGVCILALLLPFNTGLLLAKTTTDQIIDSVDDLQYMAPGHWYEVPNSKLSEAGCYPDPLPFGFVGAVMSAWSGGVFDTKRNQLLIWGGGHTDYAGNEIYSFDLTTLSWSRLWGPTPKDSISVEWDVYDSYSDGNPSARHTYNAIVYIPDPMDMILNTGGARWNLGTYLNRDWSRWFFHLDDLAWKEGQSSPFNCDSGIAFDSLTQKVIARERYYVREYDLETDTFTREKYISGGWSAKTTGAFDPVFRKMLFIGEGAVMIFDVDTFEYDRLLSGGDFSGDTEILSATSPGLEYHPGLGKFVAWSGERSHKEILRENVYVIDIEARTIEKRYASATNNVRPTDSAHNGTYGRFRYIPEYDSFIVVNSVDENVYFYKLSDSTVPPPDYGATYTINEPRISTNLHSIGVEWDIEGDYNHNATASVRYRKIGESLWYEALDLFRVDHLDLNMMAGSIMFLEPGTSYEVELNFYDPDGGSSTELLSLTTRSTPELPKSGRTLHVVPGTGDGDGSENDPFHGIADAQAVAQPGDTFLLHVGYYGEAVFFEEKGDPDNYIVWKAAGDGEVLFDGIVVGGSYAWFEGLHVRVSAANRGKGIRSYGDKSTDGPYNVVIKNNLVTNENGDSIPWSSYVCLIYLHDNATNWFVTDNVLVGNINPDSETFSGEGIELWHSHGHAIAHNIITHVADGISYPGRNVDIYGNDIFNVADDGIEPDFGYTNVRIWKNRITNAFHNGISLQDFDNGAPWYIIRNQIFNYEQSMLKTRSNGRFVFLHNTVVTWDNVMQYQTKYIINGFVKNNLLVSYDGGEIWNFEGKQETWRTDIDYNGFDWGSYSAPFHYPFKALNSIELFQAVSASDHHSIVIDKNICFNLLEMTGPMPERASIRYLNLVDGCNAIDAGIILPNINDDFNGEAPDLGAYEFGAQLPQFGPRDNKHIVILTQHLSDAGLQKLYQEKLTVYGAASDYTWSLIQGTLPQGISLSADGVISGTATETGEFAFTVRVVGADNAFTEKKFTIIVSEIATNDPPTIEVKVKSGHAINNGDPASITMKEGELLELELITGDPDYGDEIELSYSGLPSWVVLNGHNLKAQTDYTMSLNSPYDITFMATDSAGNTTACNVRIYVSNVNRGPFITPIPDKTIDEWEKITFTVSAVDIDGDPIELSVNNLPDGAVFNVETGEFVWIPSADAIGTYTLAFTASDGVSETLPATETVQIIVEDDPLVEHPFDKIKPGEWYEIPYSALNASGEIPEEHAPGYVQTLISAWSGAVYDSTRERLVLWGGGPNYAGNEIYAFDINTLSWERIWGPTPNKQIPTEYLAYEVYADGNPSSRHTYGNLAYIPETDAMWNGGGSVWKAGSHSSLMTTTMWHYNFGEQQWLQHGTYDKNEKGRSAAYDAKTGHVFTRGLYGIFEYNPVSYEWTKRFHYGAGWWNLASSDIDPENRIMVMIGDGSIEIFNLETYELSVYTAEELNGDTELVAENAPGIAFHPGIKKFIVWCGTDELGPENVYIIDLDTLTIKKQDPAATNTTIPTESTPNGTYGRFRYIASKDLFIVVNSIFQNVFVYRLETTGNAEDIFDLSYIPQDNGSF